MSFACSPRGCNAEQLYAALHRGVRLNSPRLFGFACSRRRMCIFLGAFVCERHKDVFVLRGSKRVMLSDTGMSGLCLSPNRKPHLPLQEHLRGLLLSGSRCLAEWCDARRIGGIGGHASSRSCQARKQGKLFTSDLNPAISGAHSHHRQTPLPKPFWCPEMVSLLSISRPERSGKPSKQRHKILRTCFLSAYTARLPTTASALSCASPPAWSAPARPSDAPPQERANQIMQRAHGNFPTNNMI